MFKFDHNLLAYKLSIAQELPVLQKVSDPIAQAIQQSIAVSCTLFVKSGKKEWTGSGFHLGQGYVATAGHVVPVELQGTAAEINATFDGKNFFVSTRVTVVDNMIRIVTAAIDTNRCNRKIW